MHHFSQFKMKPELWRYRSEPPPTAGLVASGAAATVPAPVSEAGGGRLRHAAPFPLSQARIFKFPNKIAILASNSRSFLHFLSYTQKI